MTPKLTYRLSDRYIHNWLVAGPLVLPEASSDQYVADDFSVTETPVDLGPLGPVTASHPLMTWRYYRCPDDHFIDFTTFSPAPQRLVGWAFARLAAAAAQQAILVFSSTCPVELQLNGTLIFTAADFPNQPASGLALHSV